MSKHRLVAAICALAAAGSGTALSAQESGGARCTVELEVSDAVGIAGDVMRLAALRDTAHSGSFVLRRGGQTRSVDICAVPTSLQNSARRLAMPREARALLLPSAVLVTGNSAYARPSYDGALWNGRGVNGAASAGARISMGPVTAALAPVITWSSNADFDMVPASRPTEFGHRWFSSRIDAPARFGDGAITTLDAGSSFLRVDLAGFATGISNEHIIWGPAARNPLMLSTSAPGFPHVFLETARPRDIWIGRLDAQVFWGRLRESDYFDSNPDNDTRVITGLLVAFHPRPLDGLTIGGGRIQTLTFWPEMSLTDAFLEPYRGVSSNRFGRTGDNQLVTFFFRLASARAGLEAYGEWARDDHWGEPVELLRNLDSSQAWTIGLQKLVEHGSNALRVRAELTHLADALPSRFGIRQGPISFYTHSAVGQGHTHRGRILGAAIGTGGESLFVGADYFSGAGRSSISFERARYEEDAYNVFYADDHGATGRDSELSLALAHLLPVRYGMVHGELGFSRRYNRGFVGLADLPPGSRYPRENNLSFRLGLRLDPRELLR